MEYIVYSCFFFFSSRRRHTRYWRDWSSDVCSSDLALVEARDKAGRHGPRHVIRAVEEAGIDGEHRQDHQLPRHETVHRARIGVRGSVEAAIEARREPKAEAR